jgi:uncharacterized membrane protein
MPYPNQDVPTENLSALAKENLAALAEISEREEAQVSGVQLGIERVSSFVGSPGYFVGVVLFVVAWVALNTWAAYAQWPFYDEPPFFWLQGIVSSNALLLTIAVLIRQNRMSQLAQHRAHLDLQINLLTEQKVSKLLQVIDEMRRQLPTFETPLKGEVSEHTKPTDVGAMLEAIKERDTER